MQRPQHWRWVAALCALVIGSASCPPALAQINLPALGDTESEDFGIGTERKLGEQVMREIRRDPDYLDDPVLLEYIESLWQPLLAQARANGNIGSDLDQRFAWEPFLVRDRAINAFALPGGYVGVYLGLIALTASRDELASVLAHELSHVTQRHIARSIDNGRRQSLIGTAAMILGVLAAARSNSVDAANALIKEYCARDELLGYLDVNPVLFDTNGEPRMELYQADRLHFLAPAYIEFTAIIKPVIEKAWTKKQ